MYHDRRTSHLSHENHNIDHSASNNNNYPIETTDKAAVTVRNENLFNMMKMNVERDRL